MESTEQEIIKELIDNLKSIRENSFKTQAQLLIEARKTNSIYEQILHQLSRQNLLLEELKAANRLVTVIG